MNDLLIVSDLPFIVWELICLCSCDGRASFLGEAFALTRWKFGRRLPLSLPLDRCALVGPATGDPPWARQERLELLALFEKAGCTATTVEAAAGPLLDAMKRRSFDVYHFCNHGRQGEATTEIQLDADDWSERELKAPGIAPLPVLAFLNSCHSGRVRLALERPSGVGWGFLEAGAHSVVDVQWQVDDADARVFAWALYRRLLRGEPLGLAARRARLEIGRLGGNASTSLVYAIYGHPKATRNGRGEADLFARPEKPLRLEPEAFWYPGLSPAALLKADYGIVPFHLREREIADLLAWCARAEPTLVRLVTGPGGMGKTRLARELCLLMRQEGWRTGFASDEACAGGPDVIEALLEREGPLLIVVDYAESRTSFVTGLLSAIVEQGRTGPFRVVLLARRREAWWDQLKVEGPRALLVSERTTSVVPLSALAVSLTERRESYRQAFRAFGTYLQVSASPKPPANLADRRFEQVLLLHILALMNVEGAEKVETREILELCLGREEHFWQRQAQKADLHQVLWPGIRTLIAAITFCGGAPDRETAMAWAKQVDLLADQPMAVLSQVIDLIQASYPGEGAIAPLQPDLIGEYLVAQELEKNRAILEKIAFS